MEISVEEAQLLFLLLEEEQERKSSFLEDLEYISYDNDKKGDKKKSAKRHTLQQIKNIRILIIKTKIETMEENKQMKTYINNSRFMEFIDEMATQITEMNYGAETFEEKYDSEFGFTEEAQEYYNEMYSEYEMMANNIMGVYSDNELLDK